ncbi:MAG: phosphoribosylanthranilate isomerase [Acidobacteriia bacterium]|nr:phosphoribosylanthranilate isomerase [Terriglobia bacterium]MYG04391.1 phosphoribosylanthranilate isomerase [Terriglobia bacterium]MYK11254.1 phosphoribosylanthranilate isomerase [Terriglobia bacterium]
MFEGSQPALRKVCGVTRPADAVQAARSGANAIGLIFYPRSLRAVTPESAREIVEALPEDVLKVGVFVSESPAAVADTVGRAGLDVAQLHGDESPADCDSLRRAAGGGLNIWKAVRVGSQFDDARLGEFEVEAFLLDTAVEGSHGGTGTTFPWHLAVPAKRYGKVVLAGGLHGGNVADAVRAVRPWGVDASSLLESRPGVKDPQKVARYLAAAQCKG